MTAIESLGVGEDVWSFDTGKREPSVRRILRTFRFDRDDLYTLDFGGELVCCTPLHRFFTGAWTPANKLSINDRVMRRDGGWQTLTAISSKVDRQPVFNFGVEDFHNYFVGQLGLLVHNEKKVKKEY